ncbi:hypothetical protein ABZ215_25110 [Amycolatopsis sp. NPDC006131]|uniref:hypothetical protein n=1 Tax=Amycolatopsis sp. NPDC006131 TaxID=3156731 RepID=UPI0033AD5F2E
MPSRLPLTPHGKQLWDWLIGEGQKEYIGKPHPWTALYRFLIKHGVPPEQAEGLATNVLMATPAGRAAFKAGHSGHKTIGQRVVEGRRKK